MEAMVCEICGSNDIVKQDGVFVCQHCGTKYSVEEAKKLIGVVKIDNSDEVTNLFQLARRAKETNNSADAEKYYSLALEKEPSNWEAAFYSVYYKAANCRIMEITPAITTVGNSISTVASLIEQSNCDKEKALCEIISSTTTLGWAMYDSAKKHYLQYSTLENSIKQAMERINACVKTLLVFRHAILATYAVNIDNSESVKSCVLNAAITSQKICQDFYDTVFLKNTYYASFTLRGIIQPIIDTIENDYIMPMSPTHVKPILKEMDYPSDKQGYTKLVVFVGIAIVLGILAIILNNL